MATGIPSDSYLRFSDFMSIDGIDFVTTPEIPALPSSAPVFSITIKDGDRLDLLADELYGNAKLEWVLAWANEIRDLTFGLYPGMLLKVPEYSWVLSSLLRGRV